MFFKIIEKAKGVITSLAFKNRTFNMISPAVLEKHAMVVPRLQELDLLYFQNHLTDMTLSRLINGCTKSLTSLRVGYGTNSQNFGFGPMGAIALSKCKLLKRLVIGDPEEYHKSKQLEGKLVNIKKFLKHKQSRLEYLTLYQIDAYIVNILTESEERESLLQLSLAHFVDAPP
jgi:hypothetical protein